MELKTLLEELKKPFDYKWKIQSVPKEKNGVLKKGNCVAYMDARDAMDTLDKVCEEGWQSEFYEVKGKVFCKVGIKINGEWLWRSDSGALESNDNVEEETTSKGETSDAFKRACVQWGIGRFLYEKEIIWISHEEYEAHRFDINKFCKSKEGKPIPQTTPAKEKPNGESYPTQTSQRKELLVYIDEIRKEKDSNHIQVLVDEASQLYKTPKQLAWLKKEADSRRDTLVDDDLPIEAIPF